MFYSIDSFSNLSDFCKVYLPLVVFQAKSYGIDLLDGNFVGDHLGLQVVSAEEFDWCHGKILEYSKTIMNGIIHDRRNNVYRFNKKININNIDLIGIEIFEPKPNTDLSKLRVGIEHVAFLVKDFDSFLEKCQKNLIPIDKIKIYDAGKFFKTKLINNIEIEFRSNFLGKDA